MKLRAVLKRYLGAVLILLTVVLFVYFWRQHPQVWERIKHLSPLVALQLLFLYVLVIAILAVIYNLTLLLCGPKMPFIEGLLISMYSAIANFFIPLQSGVGIRALYIKKHYGVPVKAFGRVTLVYYAVFASLSLLFLTFGFTGGRLLLASGVVLLLLVIAYRVLSPKSTLITYIKLCVAVLTQMVLTACIYHTELHAVGSGNGIMQSVSYTGAASLALFVSLTPGALGFREAFLIFSKSVHHIPTQTIVAANIIDRGVYVVFLGMLFVISLVLHGKERLGLVKKSAVPPASS